MSVAIEEGRLPQLGRSAEQECERLFSRHAADVRRYARMVLRNGSDADDVVQQTFLKALRALRAGVRPERPRQWLIAIAHNECRMHFRRASRRPLEVDLEHAAETVAFDEGSTSVEAVRAALEHLAPGQRAALVLRELEGRTYEEIAATLGLTSSAVETLLFRARRALREQLEATEDCDDAQALLAADDLDELSRRRLRAHTRTCRACATLERRRRGRIAAAGRRLAGLLPFPGWLPTLFQGGAAGGAKAVAVVAAAAVATTGAVEATSAPARHHARHAAPVAVAPAPAPVVAAPAQAASPGVVRRAPRPRLAPRAAAPTPVALPAATPSPSAVAPSTTTTTAAAAPPVSVPARPAADGPTSPQQESQAEQPVVTLPAPPTLPDPTAALPPLPDPQLPTVTVTVSVPQPPVSLPVPPPVAVTVPTLTKP